MTGRGVDPALPAAPAARPAADPERDARLYASRVHLGYDGRTVIDGLDFTLPDGRITAIVGPNASGKSTLLRALGRIIKPSGGAVILDGEQIQRLPTKLVARRLGVLPQTTVTPDALRVADLVARGRTPHQSLLRQWSRRDEQAVAAALRATDTAALADRRVDELSGGQRQRAWIAMVLAQETEILLLDEPTTFLDLAHQIEVMNLVRRLNRVERRTVAVVLHDLNLACRYADYLVAMREGAIAAAGTPREIMDAAVVRAVFGVDCAVLADPFDGAPLIVPSIGGTKPTRPRRRRRRRPRRVQQS